MPDECKCFACPLPDCIDPCPFGVNDEIDTDEYIDEEKYNKKKYYIEYYQKNKESIRTQRRQYSRHYYSKNREKIIANQQAYVKRNKEKIRAKLKEYYLKNREKKLSYGKAYYLKNREKKLSYWKAYYLKNKKNREYEKKGDNQTESSFALKEGEKNGIL